MNYSSRQQPDKHWLRKVDWVLVATIAVLAIFSVLLINSAMGGGQYSANFGIRLNFLLHFRCNFCRYHHVYFT